MPYSQYVNIKQGTRSSSRYSNGNTLPLVQLPFGMNGFTRQTNSNRNPWFYHPDDRSLEGIRRTHQPSSWIGDYTPYVNLLRYKTTLELALAMRGGMIMLTYSGDERASFSLFAMNHDIEGLTSLFGS